MEHNRDNRLHNSMQDDIQDVDNTEKDIISETISH